MHPGVVSEFDAQLASLRRRARGDPMREAKLLALLALEREKIVTVSYRESLIQRRLASLALPPEVDALVRAALLWVWRDEEMHAVYIRGVLYRIGGFWLRQRALAQELAGAAGG